MIPEGANPRDYWPDWLCKLKMPWRVIAGRAEDVNALIRNFRLPPQDYRYVYHYEALHQLRSVKTVWPFLFIESAPADEIAAFMAQKLLKAAKDSGHQVITIPHRCISEGFDDVTNMCASTLVEMARKRARKRLRTVDVTDDKMVAQQIETNL